MALIGSLLRPDLVTDSVALPLACDTSADPARAGSLVRTDGRPPVSAAVAIDADGMKAELLGRLARAVSAEHS